MDFPFKNFIQVAGVIDEIEARMLIGQGVDFLGFPLHLDVNQEDLTEQETVNIVKSLCPFTCNVLITYLDKATEIANMCCNLGINIVQLHGNILPLELLKLKAIAPNLWIIKSLIVRKKNFTELETTVNNLGTCIDAFIIDTFNPVTGASGATGKIHDWKISRKIVTLFTRPIILAGGLNPKNVQKAILEVKPAGVDVHTGVEDAFGRKDPKLIEIFLLEARKGFAFLK